MTCTHPRQPHPSNPEKRLPCAWPGCSENGGGLIAVATAPLLGGVAWRRPGQPVDPAYKLTLLKLKSVEYADDTSGKRWFVWEPLP